MEAELLIYIKEILVERHALVFRSRSNLADEADSRWCTFVAHLVIAQPAETLLAATDVLVRAFPHTDTVRNPLEAGVLIRQRNALFISNLAQHLTRYDGLHEVVLRTHLAQTLHCLDVVVSEHHAGLVSVDNRPFAILIAADDSQTVSIGVAGNHKVGIQFRSQVHAHRHRLCVLGIRAQHRWEVAVNHHLLRHHVDILETPRTQAHGYNLTTCTMQRRIDDVQVFLAQNHILVHHAGLAE